MSLQHGRAIYRLLYINIYDYRVYLAFLFVFVAVYSMRCETEFYFMNMNVLSLMCLAFYMAKFSFIMFKLIYFFV